jgi:hypothetical protein
MSNLRSTAGDRIPSTSRSPTLRGALAIGILACGAMLAAPANAQPLEGCPSKEILARFEDFGRTGKMPPDMARGLAIPRLSTLSPSESRPKRRYRSADAERIRSRHAGDKVGEALRFWSVLGSSGHARG